MFQKIIHVIAFAQMGRAICQGRLSFCHICLHVFLYGNSTKIEAIITKFGADDDLEAPCVLFLGPKVQHLTLVSDAFSGCLSRLPLRQFIFYSTFC